MIYKIRLDSYDLYKNGKCLDYGDQSYTDLYYYKYVLKFTLVEGTWNQYGNPVSLTINGANLNPKTKVEYIKYNGSSQGTVTISSNQNTLPHYLALDSTNNSSTTTPFPLNWSIAPAPNNGSNYTFEISFTSIGFDENITSLLLRFQSAGSADSFVMVSNPTLNYQPTISINVVGEMSITNLNAMSQIQTSYVPVSKVTKFKFYGIGITRNVDILMKSLADTTSNPLPLMSVNTYNYTQSNPFVFLMSRSMALAPPNDINSISFRTVLATADNQPTVGMTKITKFEGDSGSNIFASAQSPNIVNGQVLQTAYRSVSTKDITVVLKQEQQQLITITKVINRVNGGVVLNTEYSKNGGAWTSMPTTITALPTDQISYRATFNKSINGTSVYGRISTVGGLSIDGNAVNNLQLTLGATVYSASYSVTFTSESIGDGIIR